ncbi:MAG: ATP-binding protein, partial [Cyclobacteriaceae bacterium]
MSKSINNRLSLAFVIMTSIIILSGICSFYYLHLGQQMRDFDDQVEHLQLLSQQLFMADQEFFNLAANSSDFYLHVESPELLRRDSLNSLLHARLSLVKNRSQHFLNADHAFGQLDSLLLTYDKAIQQTLPLLRQRGFKDLGLEGKMRRHARWLEDHNYYSLQNLLMLRRHEKNYFLRGDDTYLTLFNELSRQMKARTDASQEARMHLQEYTADFNQIAELEKRIGFTAEAGLKMQINELKGLINQEMSSISLDAHEQLETLMVRGQKIYIAMIVLNLLTALFISYLMSKRIANPIINLTQTIKTYINSHFRQYTPVKLHTEVSEIKDMQAAFDELIRHLQQLLEEAEQHNVELEAQNDQLRKINQELDMFVYSASHDLRAPLTSLEGLVDLCKTEEDASERAYYHELMLNRIQKLDHFIHDIIDYARNNRLEVNREEVIMEDTISEVLENYRFMPLYDLISKQIEVKQNTLLFIDKKRLEVILRNLISNAIRYADTHKPDAFLRISAQINRQHLCLAVEDNGVGIKPDKMDRIFDMFYRANDLRPGSGLG